MDNGKFQFDIFNDSHFKLERNFFHWGRISIYRDLDWCWLYDADPSSGQPVAGGASR